MGRDDKFRALAFGTAGILALWLAADVFVFAPERAEERRRAARAQRSESLPPRATDGGENPSETPKLTALQPANWKAQPTAEAARFNFTMGWNF